MDLIELQRDFIGRVETASGKPVIMQCDPKFAGHATIRIARDDQPMVDDPLLTCLASTTQTLFLLVEVKTDLCNINGPWSERATGNMQRVIRRLGFADPNLAEKIADDMYSHLRWEDDSTVLQYIAIGKRANDGRQRTYPQLKQIVWEQIANFLFDRFQQFPEKLPSDGRTVHEQWPDFGRAFGRRFRKMDGQRDARKFVWDYIDQGAK